MEIYEDSTTKEPFCRSGRPLAVPIATAPRLVARNPINYLSRGIHGNSQKDLL
jgi:hypothetical protein